MAKPLEAAIRPPAESTNRRRNEDEAYRWRDSHRHQINDRIPLRENGKLVLARRRTKHQANRLGGAHIQDTTLLILPDQASNRPQARHDDERLPANDPQSNSTHRHIPGPFRAKRGSTSHLVSPVLDVDRSLVSTNSVGWSVAYASPEAEAISSYSAGACGCGPRDRGPLRR